MKAAGLVFIVIAAFVLQMKVSLFGVAPALTAVVAYSFGIKSGATRGMFFGSLIGIVEDSISGNMLGPNLLGKGMVGFFASFSSGSVFRWTPLLGVISLFILTVLDGLVVFLARTLFQTMPTSPSSALLILLLQGLLNACVGFFIKPRNVE
ncbi:MAG: rod shape-determining protein MreD [Nitrospirae bacterium]|nr:rod shape-determining protein MreD [Nitrospirota bacterium]